MRRKRNSNRSTAKPNAQAIFAIAVNFEFATLLLAKNTIDRSNATAPGQSCALPSIGPTIVLSALSLELYLKCLLTLETGRYPPTHEVSKLFDAVSKPRRERIKDLFDEEFNRIPHMIHLRAQATDTKDFEVEGLLQNANKAFVEWRYAFEGLINKKSGISTQPVRNAVVRVILEIKPEWGDLHAGPYKPLT